MKNIKSLIQVKEAEKQFYHLNIIWSLFFATGNWLFWWRHFLTNGQIGAVDGFIFLVGMLAEIPSGAIADRLGRRRAMKVAALLMGLGYFITGVALHGSMILGGFVIYMLGSALFSGTDDALMYDFLKTHQQVDRWEAIARKKQLVRRMGNLAATFIGGFLFIWSPRLPSAIRGLTFLLMFIPIARMAFMEKTEKYHTTLTLKGYFRHIGVGMREVLNRRLLSTTMLIIAVQGLALTCFVQGILRPLMLERSGLNIDYHAFFLTAISLIVLPLLWVQVRKAATAYSRAIFWSICILLGFALNIPAGNLVLNLTGITILFVAASMILPATSTLINAAVSSEHRATAISTASMLEDLPYVVLAPCIGLIVDKGLFTRLMEGVTIALAAAIFASLLFEARRRKLVSA